MVYFHECHALLAVKTDIPPIPLRVLKMTAMIKLKVIPKIPIICNLSWVSNNDVNVIMVIGILPDVNCLKTFEPYSLLQKLRYNIDKIKDIALYDLVCLLYDQKT